jgi:hypothetical protein
MRAAQGQEPATRDEPVRVEVLGEFARIQAAEKDAASSVTMLALVNRAQARLELASPEAAQQKVESLPVAAGAIAPILLPREVPHFETPKVEIFEPAPVIAAAAPSVFGGPRPSAGIEIGTIPSVPPQSISSPTPAVATNENESFPL